MGTCAVTDITCLMYSISAPFPVFPPPSPIHTALVTTYSTSSSLLRPRCPKLSRVVSLNVNQWAINRSRNHCSVSAGALLRVVNRTDTLGRPTNRFFVFRYRFLYFKVCRGKERRVHSFLKNVYFILFLRFSTD